LFIDGKENKRIEKILIKYFFCRDMAYARFLARYPAIGKVKFEKNNINE